MPHLPSPDFAPPYLLGSTLSAYASIYPLSRDCMAKGLSAAEATGTVPSVAAKAEPTAREIMVFLLRIDRLLKFWTNIMSQFHKGGPSASLCPRPCTGKPHSAEQL